MIHTEKLQRTYKKHGRGGESVHAVTGIDLHVETGELVGFLGPNGAGKSTTLRMLATLLRPTGGRATVAGCDLLRDPAGVRRRIGYVAQGSGTSDESTVLEELSLQGRLFGMSEARMRSRCAELLGQLQLTELSGRRVETLSGGQRRRLDLALGLIHTPSLLMLDEPTTGLDVQSRRGLWQIIRSMHAERETTLLLSTHYLEEADELADRLIIVDQGRIVAEGSPDALKARISGDGVTVDVHPDSVARTADLVTMLPGIDEVVVAESSVRFRVPRGDTILPEMTRSLHRAGITATSLQVRRPTLDDVFLALTGRSLRES